jgi:phosphohistidine phosphatase SixA
MMEKTLIIIRHAHRNLVRRQDDNGLSEKGHRQAEAIRNFFKKRRLGKDLLLLSSPRLRCRETIEPIAKLLEMPIEISDLLDEGASTQAGRLDDRILDFKTWWKEHAPKICVICSHGDWIPSFFDITLNKSFELQKGGWAELKLHPSGKISLEESIQSWD